MTTPNDQVMHDCYDGEPGEKLAVARALFADLAGRLAASERFAAALTELRGRSETLAAHMRAMDLGHLCTRCAAGPGGGCCSAFMAGNTDAIQILINLLLGVTVAEQADSGENCCFLGSRGCLFPVKPIFCLNYNCSHILAGAEPGDLATLYRHAAAVLSLQTEIEAMVLAELRGRAKAGEALGA